MISARLYGVLVPSVLTLAAGLLFLAGEWWGGAAVGTAISFFVSLVAAGAILQYCKRVREDRPADRLTSGEQITYVFVAPFFILLALFTLLIFQTSPWYSSVAALLLSWVVLLAVFYIADKEGAPKDFVGDMLGPSLVGWPMPIIAGFTLHFYGLGGWGTWVFVILFAINTFLTALGFGFFRPKKLQGQKA